MSNPELQGPNYVERDGEVMPSYEAGTPNAPVYRNPSMTQRSTDLSEIHPEFASSNSAAEADPVIDIQQIISETRAKLGPTNPVDRPTHRDTLIYLHSRNQRRLF